jgi:hypothetical protein
MQYLKITLTNDKGNTSYDTVIGMQGEPSEQLETTLEAFEDYLAVIHKIDPMVNSLEIGEAVVIN